MTHPWRKLLAVGVLVTVANAVDLMTTYAASPTLAYEWNILQRKFGMGWEGLIGAKLVGILLAVLGYAYYLRNRDRCYPGPGLDLRHFARHLTFGADSSTPGSGAAMRHLGVNLGYFWTGVQGIVLWVALDNLLLRHGFYWGFRHTSELGYHMVQSAVVGALVMARFYVGNYNRYRSASDPAASARPSAATPVGRPTYERPV